MSDSTDNKVLPCNQAGSFANHVLFNLATQLEGRHIGQGTVKDEGGCRGKDWRSRSVTVQDGRPIATSTSTRYTAHLIMNVYISKSGELTVKNHYSGVNFIDTYHRGGLYPLPLPFIPGR